MVRTFSEHALRTQGHDAELIPAQFVKAYRKANKNDHLCLLPRQGPSSASQNKGNEHTYSD
jgi:hypothetical protein